jgi:bifunctional DNase/RNase
MPEMIEMVVDSVRVSLTNQQRIIVLKEKVSERFLPIWIGPYEAEAITLALQELEVARPQTHDLIRNILAGLKARLVRVEVSALREDVYYGNLVIEVNEEIVMVDSRPSDALALAVRYHVPILVAVEVLEQAAILPENDIQDGIGSEGEETAADNSSESADRLSVFEDFLEQLDDDEPELPPADPESPEEGDK